MGAYSQANRPFRIQTTLGDDVLLLSRLSGYEGASVPFHFVVDLLSEDRNIAGSDLLRKPVTITARLPDESERVIHGLVSRFSQVGQQEDLTRYQAEVVPWLWFLSLSRDCKIFQNLSVLEIVEKVFQSQGYSDFTIKCSKSYAKREYCVQYRESHLDFVSRLLEEEGIFYFFDHSTSKHTLMLADDNSVVEPCEGPATVRFADQAAEEENIVTLLQQDHAVHPGTVTLQDYDYLQPSLNLESTLSGKEKEEVYDYPGKFADLSMGERAARLQLEAEEALRHVVRGESTCRGFQSGKRFTLKNHFRGDANTDYLILRVQHHAYAGDYRSWDATDSDYSNHFTAIPYETPYRPRRITQKPVVHGSQTAVVVGKSGEEIWSDKHGRVKVQFHWDRDGKKDENSSCWVRVSSQWAGKNWGAIQIPRIGQEVIVDFLEGDPDLPIITGRVYNAEQTPPYALPANQTQSGIKSRSSKGGGTENFNEIRFEDKKGEELVYIHAEKDKQVVVENDRTESVGNNESITIGKNRTESVGSDESITIGGKRSESVDKDESITISGKRTESVGKDESVTIGEDRILKVAKKETISVGDNRTVKVGKDDQLKVGKNLTIDAGDQITIKTGSASIVMKKDGTITIKGKDVKVNGSGKINVKASSDVTIKGSQVKQN